MPHRDRARRIARCRRAPVRRSAVGDSRAILPRRRNRPRSPAMTSVVDGTRRFPTTSTATVQPSPSRRHPGSAPCSVAAQRRTPGMRPGHPGRRRCPWPSADPSFASVPPVSDVRRPRRRSRPSCDVSRASPARTVISVDSCYLSPTLPTIIRSRRAIPTDSPWWWSARSRTRSAISPIPRKAWGRVRGPGIGSRQPSVERAARHHR